MRNDMEDGAPAFGVGVPVGRNHRRSRARIGVALMSTTLALAGCGNDPVTFACTDEARASVTVTVVDAVSGAGVARGATVILEDGAYTDSSLFAPNAPWPGDSVFLWTNTYERTGTYTVRVRRPGYALWVRQNVVVTKDRCHVVGASVLARLQPL